VYSIAALLPEKCESVRYRYCIFSGGKFVRYESFYRSIPLQNGRIERTTADILDLSSTDVQMSPTLTTRTTRDFKRLSSSIRTHEEDISREDSIIIVSYFLPVIINRSADGVWSASFNLENILSFQTELLVNWVGSLPYNGILTQEDEEIITKILNEMRCHPIFIPNKTHKQFYDIYCKRHLWPVLNHNIDVYGNIEINETDKSVPEQDLWFTFTTVNQQFRNKVVEIYQESNLIWIHGFHLMLLPSQLRRTLKLAKIGLFFHTPFPSSEIWKVLPRREELLRGILGADQLGFHLFESARHFFTTCRRILNASNTINNLGLLSINIDGREVIVSCIHVGIDKGRIFDVMRADTFRASITEWSKKLESKIVITSKYYLVRYFVLLVV
jgi:trehalose-6-phosphate synthase